MIKIEEYMLRPLTERRAHLKLDEPCVERGGVIGLISAYCRGLLAHLLDTTIPLGHKICVCHACNNGACANPNHLYWGTASENSRDYLDAGGKTFWEKLVDKYGLEEALERNKQARKLGGARGGAAGKGKKKTVTHKQKISASLIDNQNAKHTEL